MWRQHGTKEPEHQLSCEAIGIFVLLSSGFSLPELTTLLNFYSWFICFFKTMLISFPPISYLALLAFDFCKMALFWCDILQLILKIKKKGNIVPKIQLLCIAAAHALSLHYTTVLYEYTIFMHSLSVDIWVVSGLLYVCFFLWTILQTVLHTTPGPSVSLSVYIQKSRFAG